MLKTTKRCKYLPTLLHIDHYDTFLVIYHVAMSPIKRRCVIVSTLSFLAFYKLVNTYINLIIESPCTVKPKLFFQAMLV